jgi:ABC-type dipeptide/oligopeptide/nickel transport system permease subunit
VTVTRRDGTFVRLLRHRAGAAGLFVVTVFLAVVAVGPSIAPRPPTQANFRAILKAPGPGHWFGTDELGRDVLSRVVHGARLSIGMVVAAVAAAVGVGGGLGIWAGYRGGLHEAVVMRAIDVLLAMPGFLVALVIVTVLGIGTFNLILAVAVYSVPTFARVAHASALALRGTDFVQAARAYGARDGRVLARHVVPNMVSPLLVQASLRMATALLLASSLSFLGLGVQPPAPEWGAMLANGRSYLSTSPHVVLFPGLCIMLATLGFNLLGDGLRDVLDPRQVT